MSRRFLLLVSLQLNLALVGVGLWLVQHPAPPSEPVPGPRSSPGRAPGSVVAVESRTPPQTVSVPATFAWPQVVSTNLAHYAANLRAIGCPDETVRDIVMSVANHDYVRQRHLLYERFHARFWEMMANPEQFKEGEDDGMERRARELESERSERVDAALGKDPKSETASWRPQTYRFTPSLSFLPEEKQRRWFELEEQFDRIRSEIYEKTRGNAVAQKMQVEAHTKERDTARRQLLTDEEFQEYTARASSRGTWAQDLPGFEATEAEYRVLNQVHADTPTNQASQFKAQARVMLGEERYAALERGQDSRFAELVALAEQCRLPMQTAESIYQQRVKAEQQSAQVRSAGSMSVENREALLLMIQSEARQGLLTLLGETAGEAYLRRYGGWLRMLSQEKRP